MSRTGLLLWSWKHPHARGGRLGHTVADTVLTGNTPTHVGKTMSRTGLLLWSWKHPHARGGRLGHTVADTVLTGNTPTHVGKTSPSRGGLGCREKHPHARGEDGYTITVMHAGRETPPRTWGRLLSAAARATLRRNTPTHVGKTDAAAKQSDYQQKHPHARGEDPVC